MRKTVTMLTAIVLTASLVLVGCGVKKEPASGAQASAPANQSSSNVNVGMVTDMGGVNDKSFNQSAWDGLQQLSKESGAKVKYLQSKADAEYIPNLNQFLKENYTLTWGIGFLMGDSVKKAAEQNPQANLAIIDNVVNAPNVASVTFAENEGAFLVGVVAALTTKANKIGFVGGMENPVIKRFEAGFKAGVAAANPNVKLMINYTGAFNKPDLGKAAAATLYNDGVDIIFHAAGATGNGVFNEAKDRFKGGNKVWVIGVDKDQSLDFGDDITLTSMVKRVDQAVIRVSKATIDGKFPGGQTTVLGLKEEGVGLPETSKKNVSSDILKKVDDYKRKIISGEIKVPAQ